MGYCTYPVQCVFYYEVNNKQRCSQREIEGDIIPLETADNCEKHKSFKEVKWKINC